MKTGFIAIVASAALLLGSAVNAEQIKPVQKANGIVSSQGISAAFGLGGLGAGATAGLIGTIVVVGGVAASGAVGGSTGSSASQTPIFIQ
ncbi:hypothetical protein [Puniceibacterium sediminis]|uniref:Uncharacterized protein n=1 Tax=Puniceibacterium sediminis TaxID=1608407 RepID=A0A238WUH4_9RHOB|nr:hypothetical protein [Puniceibacterium sediminis]SNR50195.1 hypothetical protein SAMN06265370_107141 [Puniceibacterium sediminis]